MTRLIQICGLFVAILWSERALSSPIFESINIERKLNIDFKPLKFGPITFIKERWGPFGKFIKKHTIERRDLDEMNTIDSKVEDVNPVAEERFIPVIEKEEPILGPVPSYRSPIQSAIVVESISPPISKLNTDITGAIPIKPVIEEPVPDPVSPIVVNPYFTPAKTPEINHMEDMGAVPIVGSPPIEGPLLVPVTPEPVVPPSLPPPPPPPVEVPPGSRFGAFARFFGEILSEIVNRLIARARLSFGQFTSQPAAAAQ